MIAGRRLKTWSLLALVNLMWAAQYPAYKLMPGAMSAATVNFWVFAIAIPVLLPAAFHGKTANVPLSWRHALQFGLLGTFGLIPPSILMAWGIAHSNASNASILSLTMPVLMMLMGVMLLHERPSRKVYVSLLLAVIGTIVMSWGDLKGGAFAANTFAGNAAVFIGCAGAAFYSAGCKLLLRFYSEVAVLLYGYLVAMACCALISLSVDTTPFYRIGDFSFQTWLGLAVLGAVVWGVAMLLWTWLLKQLELGQISVSTYMLPVFGLALSAAIVHERLTIAQILGGSVVLVSAYLTSLPDKMTEVGASSLGHS